MFAEAELARKVCMSSFLAISPCSINCVYTCGYVCVYTCVYMCGCAVHVIGFGVRFSSSAQTKQVAQSPRWCSDGGYL